MALVLWITVEDDISKRNRRTQKLPWMLAELTLASWETIAQRTWLMARGRCSKAEYRRMVLEKMAAAGRSTLALDPLSVLKPWHAGATKNAKRLRRRRR